MLWRLESPALWRLEFPALWKFCLQQFDSQTYTDNTKVIWKKRADGEWVGTLKSECCGELGLHHSNRSCVGCNHGGIIASPNSNKDSWR